MKKIEEKYILNNFNKGSVNVICKLTAKRSIGQSVKLFH